MNKTERLCAMLAWAALLCFVGCLEVKPLVQGGRSGSLSCVTNAVYHGCAYRDAPWAVVGLLAVIGDMRSIRFARSTIGIMRWRRCVRLAFICR